MSLRWLLGVFLDGVGCVQGALSGVRIACATHEGRRSSLEWELADCYSSHVKIIQICNRRYHQYCSSASCPMVCLDLVVVCIVGYRTQQYISLHPALTFLACLSHLRVPLPFFWPLTLALLLGYGYSMICIHSSLFFARSNTLAFYLKSSPSSIYPIPLYPSQLVRSFLFPLFFFFCFFQ